MKDKTPKNFLCAFHREMCSLAMMDNKQIMKAFINYLGASLQAELWFEGPTTGTQESWTKLKAKFVL